MAINLKKIKYGDLGFFWFKKIKDRYLLTNEEGNYFFLTEKEFSDLLGGELNKNEQPYLSLAKKNFIKSNFNPDLAVQRYRSRHQYMFHGPILHIIVVTLRCNHQCVYCHASAQNMDQGGVDMSLDTAVKALDVIFETTSPFVVIEFQGGEPLVNWPVVEFVVEEAQKKSKLTGKSLELRLVSNFSLMTEEKYKYLLKNNVSLCVSLDGPEELHNKNRPLIDGGKKGNAYKKVAYWKKRFDKDYPGLEKRGYIWKMASIITISRFSLSYYKEIINEFVDMGFESLFLRPLDPFGFSKKAWQQIGYSADDFNKFYRKIMDYIIEVNLKGKKIEERFAKIFLVKMLTDEDINMVDFRSPCGAGTGQMAYNYNGDVYTCDEGRMLSMMGDEMFKIGNVYKDTYRELLNSPVVKTVCLASCLSGVAGCADCAFQPYCGVCPILNYFEQGNIFGQMPANSRCKINQAILGYLFEKMSDEKIKKVFESWMKR